MLKVIVKRSEWLRGKGAGNSGLVVRQEDKLIKRCCLGFVGLVCGLSDKEMEGRKTPGDLFSSNWPGGLIDESRSYRDSQLTCSLTTINDDSFISDEDRELKLIRTAQEANILFEFVD